MQQLKFLFLSSFSSFIVYYSNACAIPDPITDTVVVTGGFFEKYQVSRYGEQGWLEYLPDLNYGRLSHACSSFTSSGRLVKSLGN